MRPALAAGGGDAGSGALGVGAGEFSAEGFGGGEEAVVADDRWYIQVNDRERARLRAFVEGLDDESLAAPANEYWTVAGVLGHLAYWDNRVLVLAGKIDRGEPWVPSDAEPEGDWLTDSTRPIIQAIAPRAAAELALRIAEETDARVAELPLERMYPIDPDSPIYPARGEHRGEHLDELERALRDRG
jgi:Mycothiol maleylpyruvate isomerase N-terminal domain